VLEDSREVVFEGFVEGDEDERMGEYERREEEAMGMGSGS
jgi:hypothetical protein